MVCGGNDDFSGDSGDRIGEGRGDDAVLGVLSGDGGVGGARGAGNAGGDVSIDFFVCCAEMCLWSWLFDENLSGHRLHS